MYSLMFGVLRVWVTFLVSRKFQRVRAKAHEMWLSLRHVAQWRWGFVEMTKNGVTKSGLGFPARRGVVDSISAINERRPSYH
jgi:hypothetical protein